MKLSDAEVRIHSGLTDFKLPANAKASQAFKVERRLLCVQACSLWPLPEHSAAVV